MSFKAQLRKRSSLSLLTRRRNMRLGSKVQEVLLTVGAVLGSLCLLAAFAGVFFGIKPLMFKSGSMEPAIATGGLALSILVDANDVRVGDIVSTENSSGIRITHRVAAVAPADGYTALTLKGDANNVVDAEAYAVTEVERVFWSAPLLGYAVAGLSSPVALFLGGLLTAYLLYVAFAPRSRVADDEDIDGGTSKPTAGRRAFRPARRRPMRGRRTTSMAIGAGLILVGGAFDEGRPAWAQFADDATARGDVSAGRLARPGQPKCVLAGGLLGIGDGIVLTWSYSGDVPVTGYAFTINGVTQDAAASINLPTRDASIKIYAKNRNWKSQELNVGVDYDPGIIGIVGDSVTCTAITAS